MTTYSFSKISTYQQCPLQYKFQYIDKLPTKPSIHLIKGSKVHSMLENIEAFEYDPNTEYHDIIKNFIESPLGQEILSPPSIREHKIKLNENLEADDSLKKDETRFVGFIDRINLRIETSPSGGITQTVELIDFKTGKYKEPKYQDYHQLILYGLYMFNKYKLDKIFLRFVYVEHNLENTLLLDKSSYDVYKSKLQKDIETIEQDTTFAKKPSKLCPWCDFKDLCEKLNQNESNEN